MNLLSPRETTCHIADDNARKKKPKTTFFSSFPDALDELQRSPTERPQQMTMNLKALWPWVRFWAFVALGLVLPLSDVALDLVTATGLIKAGHSSWGWTIICLEFVPAVVCLCVWTIINANIYFLEKN